jgi:hypothetical protein
MEHHHSGDLLGGVSDEEGEARFTKTLAEWVAENPRARRGDAGSAAGAAAGRGAWRSYEAEARGMSARVFLLDDEQLLVIDNMNEEMAYPFHALARWTGLPEKRVREIVRGLKDQGLASYGVCYDEDEGCVSGSGYCLTREGATIQAHRRAA